MTALLDPFTPAGPASADATAQADRHLAAVPRTLREHADPAGFSSWAAFCAHYAPASGPLRLGGWTCADDGQPAGSRGAQVRRYEATLAVGDRIATASVTASGPVAALTAMLYDRGIAVETTAFHQRRVGAQTATFLQGTHGHGSAWAMGIADDPGQSALRAVIACANRLLSAAP